MTATAFADYVSYAYVAQRTGTQLPLNVDFNSISAGRSLNDFELYIPALLVLAIIMVLYSAAASIIKEVDKGTITRLILSKLTTFEFLSAISLNQMIISTAALGLTFLSVLCCGYKPNGSILLFFCVAPFRPFPLSPSACWWPR